MTDENAFSCSVLLIDDEPIADDVISHCLEGCNGVQIRYISQPERALEAALEINATVVLVDLRMPGMDGFDVIRMLRANPATEHLPVILL